MATTDSELIDEVRQLTDYDSALISDSDFQELVNIAKEELDSEVPDSARPLSYYGSDTHEQDRALFWLVCLFSKVKAGEIGVPTFSVNELRQNALDEQSNFWMMMFNTRVHQISGASGFGSTSLERADERAYEFDSP